MSLPSVHPARLAPARPASLSPARRGGWREARRSRGATGRALPFNRAAGLLDRTALGILAIVASTLAFPLSDLSAEALMRRLPPLEVVWLRYLVFVMMVLPVALRGRRALVPARPGLQLLRALGSGGGTLAALLSFHVLAVPTTTAIGFVAPVMVTALAALVLKETVGIRRWSAALVALLGVMVIVQPGGESFRLEALIPLAGAAASAVAVICTRLNTADGPGTTLFYTAAVGFALLTALAIPVWQWPAPGDLGLIASLGLFGALGTLLQVVAYRSTNASLLSPFTYLQILFASGLSFLFMGTQPTAALGAGAALIAASAIYTAWRERVRGVTP